MDALSRDIIGAIGAGPRDIGAYRDLVSLQMQLRADGEDEKWCASPDEVLEYTVGGDRLRDVITQVAVVERTL